MKAKILFTALAAVSLFSSASAMAQGRRIPVCVDVKDIRDTISKDDGKTMTFVMKNGMSMVNHLRTQCDSLKFGGFVWVTPPDGRVCENAQTLRALVTGEICRLGRFDAPVKSASR